VIRATTAREQKVDPAKLANAKVPYFYSTVDFAGLERFYKVTKSVGFVKKDIDLKSFVIPQAVTTK